MNIAPITLYRNNINLKKVSFAGQTEYYSGNNDKDARCHIANSHLMHKYSYVEKMNNSFVTNRIYFADPEEGVNYDIKRSHDFVVYDVLSKYPKLHELSNIVKSEDINNNILNNSQSSYMKEFIRDMKEISGYYKRLIIADEKELAFQNRELEQFDKTVYNKSKYFREYYANRPSWALPKDDAEYIKAKKDKEVADYYFAINEKTRQDYLEKIWYYEARLNKTNTKQANNDYLLSQAIELTNLIERRNSIKNKYIIVKKESDKLRSKVIQSNVDIENLQDKITQETKIQTFNSQMKITTKLLIDNFEYRNNEKPADYEIYKRTDERELEEIYKDYEKYSTLASISDEKLKHLLETLATIELDIKDYKLAIERMKILEKKFDDINIEISDLYREFEKNYCSNENR